MPQIILLRESLNNLAGVLQQCGELLYVEAIQDAMSRTDQDLLNFLTSNELWGGSGSIADQAGMGSDRDSRRRSIEHALIKLGVQQIHARQVNVRTESWVSAFKEWQERGI